MSDAEGDQEPQEAGAEAVDDREAIEVEAPPEDAPAAATESEPAERTIRPFFSVRGTVDGSVRSRAGWVTDDGDVHSLPVNDTVGAGQAELAMALAHDWWVSQLERLYQQQAQQEAAGDAGEGRRGLRDDDAAE